MIRQAGHGRNLGRMRRTAAVFVALALSAGLVAQSGSSPDLLLRQARQLDQVDGNCAAAVLPYRQAAESAASASRPATAAEALLGLAGCYERLGRPEARLTYQTVLLKYPQVGLVAAAARDRLVALSERTRGPSFTEMPVPPDAVDLGGAVSPDGRFISFVDDTFVAQEQGRGQGNLGVWDLRTGLTRLVTTSSGWEEGNVHSSVWSPDGQQIAYVWWNNREDRSEVRTVSRDGGETRTLYSDQHQASLLLFDWSPDAHSLAIVRVASPRAALQSGVHSDLVLLSVDDGSTRSLKTFGTVHVPRRATFSPDGRFLAYDWPSDEASTSRDIYLIPAAGGPVTLLVGEAASNDVLLGWFPDGRHLLYVADFFGTRDARAVAIVDGRPSLEPIVIKRDVGDVYGLGFARDGRFLAHKTVGSSDIVTITLDPVTDGGAGAPRSLLPAQMGVSRAHPAWSPRGDRIAFLQASGGDLSLAVRTVGTGELRLYPLPLGGGPERLAWQPDEPAVVLRGRDTTGRNGIYRVALEDGEMTFFSQGHTGLFSPDGRYFYYPAPPRHPTGGGIVRRDLSDGTERSVDRGRHRSVTLSPDGRLLALFNPGDNAGDAPSIAVAPADGGERRTLVRGFLELDGEIAFGHDSRFVYFTTVLPFAIWRVAVAGGEPEKVADVDGWVKHLSASPDGRQLTVGYGRIDDQVWMWENLLPAGSR